MSDVLHNKFHLKYPEENRKIEIRERVYRISCKVKTPHSTGTNFRAGFLQSMAHTKKKLSLEGCRRDVFHTKTRPSAFFFPSTLSALSRKLSFGARGRGVLACVLYGILKLVWKRTTFLNKKHGLSKHIGFLFL